LNQIEVFVNIRQLDPNTVQLGCHRSP
jgi:hypothetical protein